MSWLSKGLKTVEHAARKNPVAKASTWVGKKVEKKIASIIPHTTAAERRESMQATKEQISLYHELKETLHTAADEASKQKDIERQKINEKQIRALRRNYRRNSGYLGTESSSDVKSTLG